jgi:hypothetical protein
VILALLVLASAVLFGLDAFGVIEVAWWVCALPLIPIALGVILAFLATLLALVIGVKVSLKTAPLRFPTA